MEQPYCRASSGQFAVDTYTVIDEWTSSCQKEFTMQVAVDDESSSTGLGKSLEIEQAAAGLPHEQLGN